MIAVLPFLLAGALTFVEQDITDDISAGYRQADLDRDGSMDLILPSAVYFQRNGGFSQGGRVSLPDLGDTQPVIGQGFPICDVWADTLFMLSATTLYRVRWESGAWQVLHSQPLTWLQSPRLVPKGQNVVLQRFLHDINGDGVPEIVLPGEDGLHIYSRNGQDYAEVNRLDVFPAFQVVSGRLPAQVLWPEANRKPAFPGREMECRCSFSGNRLIVIAEKGLKGSNVRYRVRHYELDQGFALIPEKTHGDLTEPLPGSFRPILRGKDGGIDYAGCERKHAEASAIPLPILEARVTSDGGKTFQGVRAVSCELIDGFADLDGDGDLDIAVCSSDIFEGGVRETVARALTALELTEEVRVYFQDPPGRFPKEPNIVFPFKLKLDAPLAMMGDLRFLWNTCSLRGDFDGNKHFDLLLARSSDELAVHLFEGNSFSKTPNAVLAVGGEEEYEIADLDGDGRSDIILSSIDYLQETPTPHARVFLSREASP
jgi:hypothetical protein